jgi:hypothetical protein
MIIGDYDGGKNLFFILVFFWCEQINRRERALEAAIPPPPFFL